MSDKDLFDLSDCTLCPRNCHADRTAGKTGYCGQGACVTAARAALLKWEEPCLTGAEGSGAYFFCGCNLRCVFCQNRVISGPRTAMEEGGAGPRPQTPDRMAEIFLALQEQHASNINLVTPSHFLPSVAAALEAARLQGLHIPVVYNTSAYEKKEAIRRLDGLVDIYLPDLKYVSSELSGALSGAPDYFACASEAIAEMVRQCPEPLFADGSSSLDAQDDADDPLMLRGVIVRHLALPDCADDSRRVLRYLHGTYGDRIFISLMNQYTPMPGVLEPSFLTRRLSDREYESLVDYAISLGIENGFIQEGPTQSESFIPAFDGTGL
ncbi:MAG: radical SAM protein [Lachnospiraceae bacterium]|jgi:putative pyruvate formate lyase activating enzyme|nr:radical SAM protein [Lachnospiraceae bacterium]